LGSSGNAVPFTSLLGSVLLEICIMGNVLGYQAECEAAVTGITVSEIPPPTYGNCDPCAPLDDPPEYEQDTDVSSTGKRSLATPSGLVAMKHAAVPPRMHFRARGVDQEIQVEASSLEKRGVDMGTQTDSIVDMMSRMSDEECMQFAGRINSFAYKLNQSHNDRRFWEYRPTTIRDSRKTALMTFMAGYCTNQLEFLTEDGERRGTGNSDPRYREEFMIILK